MGYQRRVHGEPNYQSHNTNTQHQLYQQTNISQWTPSRPPPTRPPRPSSKDSAVPQRKPIRKSPRTATPPSALVPLPPRTPLVTRPRRRSTLASPRPTSRTSKLLVSAHEQLLRNIVRIPGG